MPIKIKEDHLTSERKFNWQGGVKDPYGIDPKHNYYTSFGMTSSDKEEMVEKTVTREAFLSKYANVFENNRQKIIMCEIYFCVRQHNQNQYINKQNC